jgi:glucose/arabinose dehydrogenase/PKD repeat protein
LAAFACLAALLLATTATAHAGATFRQRGPAFAPAASPLAAGGTLSAAAVPAGFSESVVWSGLTSPTAVRFAPDGRVFVLQQGGEILEYDSAADPTPSVWADLSTKVDWFWDRGALGMALDPQFTTGRPYIYVLYTHDAPIGGTAPRWNDACPTPPGPTTDGCVVSGRLSKISKGGGEQVLIEDWCQQFASHSVGTVAFGPDGALYAGAGDGASFDYADYGAAGSPVNPCGDPPGGVGGSMSPPTAEGGALRAQDVRTSGDPTGLDGTIIRVDPDTGAAMPDNPNAGSSDPNSRRIIAYGLRNPFRWTFKPGTSDIYLGDVGWISTEEIDRLPTGGPVENFGWPCYEGPVRQSGYDSLNVDICENLYAQGASAVTQPLYSYGHSEKVAGENCPTGGSSISGVAFYNGGTFPSQYNGALFFADYSRNCMWVMFPGANGVPDPATRQSFNPGASGPVDLQVGPDGALWYADLTGNTVRRIQATNPNHTPVARATASPTSGNPPLTVSFDGSASSDPDGDALSYAWDLDGDGAFDDSTAAKPTFQYATRGGRTVKLRVSDPSGASSTDTVTIMVGTPPVATIDTPTADTTWRVGDSIDFSGHATDEHGVAVAAANISWRLVLHHCSALVPTSCHEHQLQTFQGSSGSFSAPDHEYPAYLELVMTASDGELSSTVNRRLDPKTVALTLETQPAGLELTVGSETSAAPFTRTVIQGSTVSLIAPAPQTLGTKTYDFGDWSDGGAAVHSVVAPTTATTYRATYTERVCTTAGLAGAWGFDETSGTAAVDASGNGNAGTINGATRTTSGKFGSALSFDGANDIVSVPDSNSLDLTTGATISAWVNPSALAGAWRTAVFKQQAGQLTYGMYAGTDTQRPSGNLYPSGGGEQIVSGPSALPLNTWSHMAMTWDGNTQRLYINGSEVANRVVGGTLVNGAGPLQFGGNGIWPEWFAGRLDEVRVYSRALSAADVQADMSKPVACAGGPPPPPQPSLSVSKSALAFRATQNGSDPAARAVDVTNAGTGTLSFTASKSASWLTVTPASGTAPATLTVAASIAGMTPGTYTTAVTVAAAGATGSPKTIDVTLTIDPPAAPPALSVAPGTLSFTAAQGAPNPPAQSVAVSNSGGGSLSFTAGDDQSWLSVSPAGGTAPASVAVAVDATGLAPGSYTGTVTVTAAGATGSPKTIGVTLTVSAAPPPSSGLVGAWGFDEASGTTTADASGKGNVGTLSGPTRIAAGKFGAALSFDGVNDIVNVADAASLDLTTAATLEAWVYPTALGGSWRTVLFKEQTGQLAYGMYAHTDQSRPSGNLFPAGGPEQLVNGTAPLALNAWSHLAMTWDGATERLFVNGTQVATRAVSGTLVNGTRPLRIGGNTIWAEWFKGNLDEIRVYNRALTQSELQADMTKPVSG